VSGHSENPALPLLFSRGCVGGTRRLLSRRR
jgi:hypothetical protein